MRRILAAAIILIALYPGARSLQAATRVAASSACTNAGQVASWPLARRAAQLVVIPSLNLDVAGLSPVVTQGIGGIVLLGNSVPSDLGRRVTALNQRAGRIPLLVMADEEGGGVQRLLGLVQSFPWARQMASTLSPSQVRAIALKAGRQMAALGVKVDLAPVLDVDGGQGPNSQNPDGLRSFSPSAATVSTYGNAFIQGLRQAGILPVIKHFPGLGGSNANTDFGAADTLPYSTLKNQGLIPFKTAIATGAPAVMISNATVPGLTTGPASLSRAAVHDLLRHDLDFHGLVVTDSLSAGAVFAAGYTLPAASARSIEAGGDMILFGSTLTPAQTALLSPANVRISVNAIVQAILVAVRSHALSESRLNNAVLHVLHAKRVSLCPAS